MNPAAPWGHTREPWAHSNHAVRENGHADCGHLWEGPSSPLGSCNPQQPSGSPPSPGPGTQSIVISLWQPSHSHCHHTGRGTDLPPHRALGTAGHVHARTGHAKGPWGQVTCAIACLHLQKQERFLSILFSHLCFHIVGFRALDWGSTHPAFLLTPCQPVL